MKLCMTWVQPWQTKTEHGTNEGQAKENQAPRADKLLQNGSDDKKELNYLSKPGNKRDKNKEQRTPILPEEKFCDAAVPWLVDGHQFLHSMTLHKCSSILRAVCDDLMNCVQDGHHCVTLQILCGVLLATW